MTRPLDPEERARRLAKRTAGRLSFQPVLDYVTEHALSVSQAAELCGFKGEKGRQWWYRTIRKGYLTEEVADRVGVRLVGNPCFLWPEWYPDEELADA
jgi:hypothetical protein